MKKRIGTLYNKPIIEGDINLKTPNEIHKDELSSNNSQGGGSDKIEYFKFKEPIETIDERFKFMMSTVAFENEPVKGIIPYGVFGGGMIYNTILGFAFCDYVVNTGTEYIKAESVKQYLIIMSNPDITGIPNPDDIPDAIYEDFGIIPISKEEYYDLIK